MIDRVYDVSYWMLYYSFYELRFAEFKITSQIQHKSTINLLINRLSHIQ